MIFHENHLLADNSHEISYLIFFRKLGKMAQNLSSAAVLIGALRVKHMTCIAIFFKSKYDQEMQQSHTADQREEETLNTNSHLTPKGNLSKATSFFFPSEMIANLILETTLSTAQHSKNQINHSQNNSIKLWIVIYSLA